MASIASLIAKTVGKAAGTAVSSAKATQAIPKATSSVASTVAKAKTSTSSSSKSSGSSGSGGSSGGGGSTTTTHNLTISSIAQPKANSVKKPAALKSNATDQQKADYYIALKEYYIGEAEAQLSYYNYYKRELARLEAMYPDAAKNQAQAQEILNMRIKVADYESAYNKAKQQADTINVSVGVSTSTDGDRVTTEKTYTITDDKGSTVSTKYSEDNGGMTASELRAKQQADMEKALNASNAAVQADARRIVEEIQSGAERDYAIGAAQSTLDAYLAQYDRNLNKINEDYDADVLQQNQDLLLASNNTQANRLQNEQQANSILSQYNLGGSSLQNRFSQIADDAANSSNQLAALSYNYGMKEAARNYDDARLELENENAKYQNQFNQETSQANADYWQRLAQSAGLSYEELSKFANPDYWLGTMFDAEGNRLNSFKDMNSQAMRDYAQQQSDYYKNLQNAYGQDQSNYSSNQAGTVADQYVSDYATTAARNYGTNLRSYNAANSSRTLSASDGLQTYRPDNFGTTGQEGDELRL